MRMSIHTHTRAHTHTHTRAHIHTHTHTLIHTHIATKHHLLCAQIPMGIAMGADITARQFVWMNLIPCTFGNWIVSGRAGWARH